MFASVLTASRFLYMTVLALDANFRLRRRVISNEERDPALCSGWGYFVEDKPYREFLKTRVDDDEVCLLFSCDMYYSAHHRTRLARVQVSQRLWLRIVSSPRVTPHQVWSSLLMPTMALFCHTVSVICRRGSGMSLYVVL